MWQRLKVSSFIQWRSIAHLAAGGVILGGSALAWLRDPLDAAFTAWDLPVRLGWLSGMETNEQGVSQLLTLHYGWLCLGGALLCWSLLLADRQNRQRIRYSLMVAGCCLLPVMLFLVQYLCADLVHISLLTQHKIQSLLIQQHFGYKMPGDLYQIEPLSFGNSSFIDRLLLLFNQAGNGLLAPLVAAALIGSGMLQGGGGSTSGSAILERFASTRTKKTAILWATGTIVAAFMVVLLGRTPVGMVCDFMAKERLAAGNYSSALHWLDRAALLNPAFEKVAYYHVQRGQAITGLQEINTSADSHVYLASVYHQQGNNVGAYQELLAARATQASATPPQWLQDEISGTLISLTETVQGQNGTPVQRAEFDSTALPWLDKLLRLDTGSLYGHYVLGKIYYDLRNYEACKAQMLLMIEKSNQQDIRSSAYTYLALSLQGQGKPIEARQMLTRAIQLDPDYHNNIAREELSGLH